MDKIQVGYSKKVSTDDYGSIGISGMVEFVPKSDNLQEEYDSMFVYLQTVVNQKLDIVAPKAVPEATAQTGHIPPKPTAEVEEQPQSAGADVTVQAEPETQASEPTKDEVFLGKAKVFRYVLKKDRNKKSFAELRIGHEDVVGHIGEQYVTVKTWEPDAIQAVSPLRDKTKVRDGTTNEDSKVVEDVFVDVWGKFNPWFTDPSKHDLLAKAIRISTQ